MTGSTVNRQSVESFLDACGNTNFQVIARGSDFDGAVTPTLKKTTVYYTTTPKTTVYRQYNGLRSGVTVNGQMRVWSQAASLADGDDWYRAIVALVECGYYDQVELRPLEYISVAGEWGEKPNPIFAELDPLIWRCEGGRVAAVRPPSDRGQGKKAQFDDPVSTSVMFEREVVAELGRRASEAGVSRGELIRKLVQNAM